MGSGCTARADVSGETTRAGAVTKRSAGSVSDGRLGFGRDDRARWRAQFAGVMFTAS